MSDAPNVAPVFTTTAVTTATMNVPYQYQAHATDADGDPVSYRLVSPLPGMAINAT